jgi:hypothetical protein
MDDSLLLNSEGFFKRLVFFELFFEVNFLQERNECEGDFLHYEAVFLKFSKFRLCFFKRS